MKAGKPLMGDAKRDKKPGRVLDQRIYNDPNIHKDK